MYFHVLDDERANCWEKIESTAKERMLCFLGINERLLYEGHNLRDKMDWITTLPFNKVINIF